MPDDKKPIRKLAGDEDFDGLERAEASLPATWYYDSAHYEAELEKIFYRDWLYVCHASLLAEARSFRRFDVGHQSIVLVRDSDGNGREQVQTEMTELELRGVGSLVGPVVLRLRDPAQSPFMRST